MKRLVAVSLLVLGLAGCGDDFEWFEKSPEQFSFKSPGVVPFGLYSSNAVAINGIYAAATTVRIAGDGTYSISGGLPTSSTEKVRNGQTIKIFHNVTSARTYKSRLFVGSTFSSYSTTGKAAE